MPKWILKGIILGDVSVGKTSICRRLTTGYFLEQYRINYGAPSYVKHMSVKTSSEKEEEVILHFLNINEQTRISIHESSYFQGVDIILLVYDITNELSFVNLSAWCGLVSFYCKEIPIIMIGNKIDLEERAVSSDEAQQYAEEMGFDYVEISAKSGENVEILQNKIEESIISRLDH